MNSEASKESFIQQSINTRQDLAKQLQKSQEFFKEQYKALEKAELAISKQASNQSFAKNLIQKLCNQELTLLQAFWSLTQSKSRARRGASPLDWSQWHSKSLIRI